jgi:CRISP-associated protein Cas1
MKQPLYLIEQGCRLSREGRRLLVQKDQQTLVQVAVLQVSQVVIFGNSQLTTPALQLLLDEGVDVTLLSQHGNYYGRLVGPANGNALLRIAQVERSRDGAYALATAQQMVRGKIHNIKIFLQRYARRLEKPGLSEAVISIDQLLERVPRTTTIISLLGVEGQASAIYFGIWRDLLQPPWSFEKRIRRPPTDPVNVLLSFGYTLLSQYLLSATYAAGLEPHIGFLHQLNYNRPSLALDLCEEWRPLVVDSVVLRCLNQPLITGEHFGPGNEEYPILLSDAGKRIFIRELESRLNLEFKGPERNETTIYRKLFFYQAQRLAGALQDESKLRIYQPFLVR